MYEALGKDFCNVFPTLHAFTDYHCTAYLVAKIR